MLARDIVNFLKDAGKRVLMLKRLESKERRHEKICSRGLDPIGPFQDMARFRSKFGQTLYVFAEFWPKMATYATYFETSFVLFCGFIQCSQRWYMTKTYLASLSFT